MSTGRHARKRAAEAEERLMNEQEATLKKENAKKGAMEKDIESQRIATMRARFGGAAPEGGGQGVASVASSDSNSQQPQGAGTADQKYSTPKPLTKRTVTNPMKSTIMGMMLDDDGQGQ
jgi:hypothetical protein